MELLLNADEKVYYTRDYAKGRKRVVGNITITNKRIIRTINSKIGQSKYELCIKDICGLKMKLSPVSILPFILAVILYRASSYINFFSEPKYNILLSIFFTILSLINIIFGIIKLRSGLYIIIITKKNSHLSLINAKDSLGNIKPLILKPKKKEAYSLYDSMSATLMQLTSSIQKE